MGEVTRDEVFLQAAGCMENLVGGSGHLTSYHLDAESFVITAARPLGDGLTEFAFSALATAESEFMDAAEEPPVGEPADAEMEPAGAVAAVPAGPVRVSAAIVLDEAGNLALDDDGNVRLTGYSCLPPSLWHPDHRAR